ncbi:MAG TPA: molybdenum cofactor guanylyltransferase [Devosia sp.]|nr:molybdenum cofactor guanylyltransferase [Devosia sp.]
MPDPRIAAAILAGGRGERLGSVNKALLDVGGRRIIDRVLTALAGLEPILICAGPNSFPADIGVALVTDLPTPYAGPLAGVAAAVAALSASVAPELLLTVAGDTPFFPHDFVERARRRLAHADVVVAAYGEHDYPTNALWRFEALKSLPAAVFSGDAPKSLKRLIEGQRAQRLDYAQSGSANPFANANSPLDLDALRARAKAENPD